MFLVWMRSILSRLILLGILMLIFRLNFLNFRSVGLMLFGRFVVFMMMMWERDFSLFMSVSSCEMMRRFIFLLVFFFLGVMELILLMKMMDGVFFFVFLNVFLSLFLFFFVSFDMIFGLLISKKKVLVLFVMVRVMSVFFELGGSYSNMFFGGFMLMDLKSWGWRSGSLMSFLIWVICFLILLMLL